ncbi:dihydrofolate reductase family protein, partial [Wenyingzhuangia sp. 1_MG-2023]|nr:dihydrofolate reductase family protein [Wenyingzhuangia sp. 1_MG-2023]
YLAEQGHNDIVVESGARLAAAFVETGLVNELVLYCAPTLLGSNARPLLALPLDSMQQQIRWHWQDIRMVGQDLRLTLQPEAARP